MLILAISLLSLIAEAAEFCTPGNKLCFRSKPEGSLMKFEIETAMSGWVSVGFGTQMNGADFMVAFRQGNQFIVEDRYGSGRTLPPKSTVQASRIVVGGTNGSSVANGKTTYVYTRPLAFSDSQHRKLDKGQSRMIWALTNTPVSGTLAKHTEFGSFTIDLYSDEAGQAGADRKTMILIHGVFMFLAWTVFSTTGAFLARYAKQYLGIWWFRLHVGLLVLAVIFSIIAFGLAVSVTPTGEHFVGPHQAMGLVIFILMFFQSILGKVIDYLFDPNRKEIPIYDKIHWWFGRVLILFAMANVLYGFWEYAEIDQSMGKVLFYTGVGVSGVVVVVFILGELFCGQTHHQEPAQQLYQDYMSQYYKPEFTGTTTEPDWNY